MKNHILIAGAVVAALAIPFAADAQSGATTGAAGSVKGFVQDINGLAVKHNEFRRVLYTKNLQLVVMALKPKEEIGAEVHKLDQFFRVEEGPARRFSMEFGRRSRRASQSSSPLAPSTTSSIPGAFH